MAKFMNIVRCKVKPSSRDEYLKKINEMPKLMDKFLQSTLRQNPMNFL